jgi:hypothetical protein
MKAFGLLIVATSLVALDASAFAATVTPIKGTLQINTGHGFQKVSGPTQVVPGSAVMVGLGGKGEIRYSDGCRIQVTPGSLAIVAPISPCAQGAAEPDPPSYSVPSAWYIAGGANAAGGVAYAISRQHSNDSNTIVPCSP